MNGQFENIKAILFDLDGTVYLGGKLIGQSDKTLAYLRDKGIRVGFLTNNSSRTDEEYLQKFKAMNIWDSRDIFLSSLGGAAYYLNKHYAGKTVYPFASRACAKYLEEAGVTLATAGKEGFADILLLTFNKEFDYQKMVIANELMVRGAVYIATHPDNVCPTEGISTPDAGAFIQMFKVSSGRTPDIIIGKPYTYMAEIIAERLALSPQEILMVGDRLHTDIAFGKNAGLKTALVLSGESTLQDYDKSGITVDAVLQDVNCLKEYF